jgi:hypothetical protein
MKGTFLVVLGVLCSLLCFASAKVAKGDIISKSDWEFVSKFCYSDAGAYGS